ncbi:hypothetical protein H5410_058914 [Solanum commersonii]|uniref:Uncharacterized protein n=1 Tax=Solanum commersonii TaxID=4109 RepID=A0A9J5W1D7_SOLCO|nr:hypothetical protein H5410_058914 [Solanum commersonii]
MNVRYNLYIAASCPEGKQAHLQVQISHEAGKSEITDFCDSRIFLTKKFMNVRYDHDNGNSWSRRANMPIFKFK